MGFSQKNTYFGGELAMTGDVFDMNDPCGLLTSTNLITGYWGFSVGQEINRNLLIETGFFIKYYDVGYGYSSGFGNVGFSSNAFDSRQIPVRLKARFNLLKDRLFLTTTVGYHFCFNYDYGDDYGSGGSETIIGNDTVNMSYTVRALSKDFSLIETGVGLEFALFDGFIVSLSSSYYAGLKKIYQMDITRKDADCISTDSYGISKGSYWSVAFGVKYAVSNLWKKK